MESEDDRTKSFQLYEYVKWMWKKEMQYLKLLLPTLPLPPKNTTTKKPTQNYKELQTLNYLIVLRETEEIISCVLFWCVYTLITAIMHMANCLQLCYVGNLHSRKNSAASGHQRAAESYSQALFFEGMFFTEGLQLTKVTSSIHSTTRERWAFLVCLCKEGIPIQERLCSKTELSWVTIQSFSCKKKPL